jgi:hypothetical protein
MVKLQQLTVSGITSTKQRLKGQCGKAATSFTKEANNVNLILGDVSNAVIASKDHQRS